MQSPNLSTASVDQDADVVVRVICGPTAAGKSSLAMQLAERLPITIISADSRQIYRHFDIGTAKPSRAERALVPHVAIDVIDPTERWSAWHWAECARAAIDAARRAGRHPVIVGGTGFYIRALTHPISNVPTLDADRRQALSDWLDRQPAELLRRWCERLDSSRASLGPVQWRRAIEVALLGGVRLSDLHAGADTAQPLAVRYLVVDPGTVLQDRIRSRVHAMFDAGWTDEVERLLQHVPDDAPAWQATGYGEVMAHVRGIASRSETIEQVTIRTRQYAKRQRTWFRHQLDPDKVTHVSPLANDAMDQVLTWWQARHQENV